MKKIILISFTILIFISCNQTPNEKCDTAIKNNDEKCVAAETCQGDLGAYKLAKEI